MKKLMIYFLFIGLLLMLHSTLVFSQVDSSKCINRFFKHSNTLNKKRLKGVIASESTVYLTGNIGLYSLWYKDYSNGKFHFFNDNSEWLYMDKFGHAAVAYNLGFHGHKWLRWSGLSETKSIIYGGSLGFIFLSSVEVMDGFSSGWGFSWGDIAANSLGSSLFIAQQLFFHENIFQLKYSYHQSSLTTVRPELLGSNLQERVLKDYNGQTYWLSTNLRRLTHLKAIPNWLCFATGYSINGFVGATDNVFSQKGNLYDYSNIKRYNQLLLSLDIDMSKIQSKRPWLNSLIHTVGFIKIPFPTLEINRVEGMKFHPIYF